MFTIDQGSTEYGAVIAKFVQSEFPRAATKTERESLELLSSAVFGTKQSRLGPMPSPEIQVAVRKVLEHAMKTKSPVRIMVPWGSEKPDHSTGIDIAELGAFKTLACLQSRVSEVHEPGIHVRIRAEDASAQFLFQDESKREGTVFYTNMLKRLPRILDMPFVSVVPESELISEEAFNIEAGDATGLFEEQIRFTLGRSSLDFSHSLHEIGFQGALERETVEHYMASYRQLYPELGEAKRIEILARYFASALARRTLNIRGNLKEWGDNYIDLSFVAPPPGTESYFGRRVLYRTLPASYTGLHIPPWRAKGYLQMGETDACPKLMSFKDPAIGELVPHVLTLRNANDEIEVRADYRI
jgi:hypothetical protein